MLRGLSALVDDCDDLRLAGTGTEASELVDLYKRHRPDVTVLDTSMPSKDDVDPLTAIGLWDPTSRVIVITELDSGEDIEWALRAGARAYLAKNVALGSLANVIRAVHRGATYIPPAIAGRLAEYLRRPHLTPREREVLGLLIAGRSNKEIQAELAMSASTAKTHIAHIFQKLGVSGRTQAVNVALTGGTYASDTKGTSS